MRCVVEIKICSAKVTARPSNSVLESKTTDFCSHALGTPDAKYKIRDLGFSAAADLIKLVKICVKRSILDESTSVSSYRVRVRCHPKIR